MNMDMVTAVLVAFLLWHASKNPCKSLSIFFWLSAGGVMLTLASGFLSLGYTVPAIMAQEFRTLGLLAGTGFALATLLFPGHGLQGSVTATQQNKPPEA